MIYSTPHMVEKITEVNYRAIDQSELFYFLDVYTQLLLKPLRNELSVTDIDFFFPAAEYGTIS